MDRRLRIIEKPLEHAVADPRDYPAFFWWMALATVGACAPSLSTTAIVMLAIIPAISLATLTYTARARGDVKTDGNGQNDW